MARKTLEVTPLAMHFKLSLTNAFPCQARDRGRSFSSSWPEKTGHTNVELKGVCLGRVLGPSVCPRSEKTTLQPG